MSNLLYKCQTKATNKEKGDPRHSSNWITSRRTSFCVYDEHIECGNWYFEAKEIKNPILFKSKQGFIKFDLIQFDYKDQTYQFGFNPWAHPAQYINIDFKIEYKNVKFSPFSIVLRLLLIGVIVYYIVTKLLG